MYIFASFEIEVVESLLAVFLAILSVANPAVHSVFLFSDHRCCCCSTHSKSNSCYTKARSKIFLGRFKVATLNLHYPVIRHTEGMEHTR